MFFKLYNTLENPCFKLCPVNRRFTNNYKYIAPLPGYDSMETIDECYDATISEDYYWFPVVHVNPRLKKSILCQQNVEYTFKKGFALKRVHFKTPLGEVGTIGDVPKAFQQLLPEKGILQFNGNIAIPYFYFYWSQNLDN